MHVLYKRYQTLFDNVNCIFTACPHRSMRESGNGNRPKCRQLRQTGWFQFFIYVWRLTGKCRYRTRWTFRLQKLQSTNTEHKTNITARMNWQVVNGNKLFEQLEDWWVEWGQVSRWAEQLPDGERGKVWGQLVDRRWMVGVLGRWNVVFV